MGVSVREKVKGSGVSWVFVNHKGERASMMIWSEKAALEVQQTVEAQLKLGYSHTQGAPGCRIGESLYRAITACYWRIWG